MSEYHWKLFKVLLSEEVLTISMLSCIHACYTVDAKTQQRPEGWRSEKETEKQLVPGAESAARCEGERSRTLVCPAGVTCALGRCISLEPEVPAQVWEGRGHGWKWWEHLDSWLCWLNPLTGNQVLLKGGGLCLCPGCEGLAGLQSRLWSALAALQLSWTGLEECFSYPNNRKLKELTSVLNISCP